MTPDQWKRVRAATDRGAGVPESPDGRPDRGRAGWDWRSPGNADRLAPPRLCASGALGPARPEHWIVREERREAWFVIDLCWLVPVLLPLPQSWRSAP